MISNSAFLPMSIIVTVQTMAAAPLSPTNNAAAVTPGGDLSGSAPDNSVCANHELATPLFGFHEQNIVEAFDSSTESGGETSQEEGRFGNETTCSPPEGSVDLQRIDSPQASSNDLGAEEEAYHQTLPSASEFDDVARMRPSNDQPLRADYPDLSFLDDFPYPPQVFSDFFPQGTTHPQTENHTRIQPGGYPAACPAEGNGDEYSSSDQSSSASPTKAKSSRKPKAQTTKALPKKKSKPKKRRTRAGRNSNGSSSSSSSTGGTSNLGPDPEGLEGVHTERARAALDSWNQRLRDLVQFKEEHGHSK
jgi:hypothetical protein